MGGYGSGRWGDHVKKTTVEECLALDAAKLARDGLIERSPDTGSLRWTRTATGEEVASVTYVRGILDGELVLTLLYNRTAANGTRHAVRQAIALEATYPPVGGECWRFACPLAPRGRACGRRARKLYLPPGARYFGCRTCQDLTYTSSQESHKYDSVFSSLARATGFDPAFVKRVLSGR